MFYVSSKTIQGMGKGDHQVQGVGTEVEYDDDHVTNDTIFIDFTAGGDNLPPVFHTPQAKKHKFGMGLSDIDEFVRQQRTFAGIRDKT